MMKKLLFLLVFALPVMADQLFPATATPKVAADADTGAVELGVKFTTSTAGRITAIRFYKGAGNGGAHVGNLWSSTGAKLGSATFTGETATGWQQATLATPVQIAAGSYTASYFAPQGRYAVDNPYAFPRTAGALTATAGVFKYGASSFPSTSFGTSNYWVDVVFEATVSPPVPPVVDPPAAPATGTAVLSWSAPTQNTDGTPLVDLSGYYAYHGLSAASLTDKVQVSGLTYTFTGLSAGTHYFAVSAYNAAGVESAKSAVGSKVIIATPPVVVPPVDPCVADPLKITSPSFPTAATGNRRIGYDSGAKAVANVEYTAPGTLKITDTRGCAATVTK